MSRPGTPPARWWRWPGRAVARGPLGQRHQGGPQLVEVGGGGQRVAAPTIDGQPAGQRRAQDRHRHQLAALDPARHQPRLAERQRQGELGRGHGPGHRDAGHQRAPVAPQGLDPEPHGGVGRQHPHRRRPRGAAGQAVAHGADGQQRHRLDQLHREQAHAPQPRRPHLRRRVDDTDTVRLAVAAPGRQAADPPAARKGHRPTASTSSPGATGPPMAAK